jgi:hypothetical protein
MQLPALLFPRTAPRPSALAALFPLFEPLLVMAPPALPGFTPAQPDGPLAQAGLVRALSPAGDDDAASGAEARRLSALLRQWEQWVAEHHGSGQAEALKAGLALPDPDFESRPSLRGDIKTYGLPKPAGGQAGPPPEVEAALWLHLLHRQDQQAGELEDLMARAEAGQRSLGQLMGLNEEDREPADYEQGFATKLAPLDYDLDEGRQVVRRLKAWAILAGGLEAGQAWLATTSLATVSWLGERVNARLAFAPGEFRSPAGALSPLGAPPQAEPDPDSPLMQEAFRLVLPDLSRLDEAALLDLRDRLTETGALEPARRSLEGLLERLSREPWSARLKAELSTGGRALAEALGQTMAEALGLAEPPTRGLSVLALPGLTRADLLALMAGGAVDTLPRREDWPSNWPAGSLPLLAAWS